MTSERPWRTLIRVEDIDFEQRLIYVVIPAWDTSATIPLQWQQLPAKLIELVKTGKNRFHAKVNLGAETQEALSFAGWEINVVGSDGIK